MGSHLQVAHGLFTALSGSQNKTPALAEVADFEQADIDRLVPNPARKEKKKEIERIKRELNSLFYISTQENKDYWCRILPERKEDI